MPDPSPSGSAAPDPDTPSVWFYASRARALADCARRLGLRAPTFVSPPRQPHTRTIARRSGGGCIVAVRLRGRACGDVTGDMVDGVIAANNLTGDTAASARAELAAACDRIPPR